MSKANQLLKLNVWRQWKSRYLTRRVRRRLLTAALHTWRHSSRARIKERQLDLARTQVLQESRLLRVVSVWRTRARGLHKSRSELAAAERFYVKQGQRRGLRALRVFVEARQRRTVKVERLTRTLRYTVAQHILHDAFKLWFQRTRSQQAHGGDLRGVKLQALATWRSHVIRLRVTRVLTARGVAADNQHCVSSAFRLWLRRLRSDKSQVSQMQTILAVTKERRVIRKALLNWKEQGRLAVLREARLDLATETWCVNVATRTLARWREFVRYHQNLRSRGACLRHSHHTAVKRRVLLGWFVESQKLRRAKQLELVAIKVTLSLSFGVWQARLGDMHLESHLERLAVAFCRRKRLQRGVTRWMGMCHGRVQCTVWKASALLKALTFEKRHIQAAALKQWVHGLRKQADRRVALKRAQRSHEAKLQKKALLVWRHRLAGFERVVPKWGRMVGMYLRKVYGARRAQVLGRVMLREGHQGLWLIRRAASEWLDTSLSTIFCAWRERVTTQRFHRLATLQAMRSRLRKNFQAWHIHVLEKLGRTVTRVRWVQEAHPHSPLHARQLVMSYLAGQKGRGRLAARVANRHKGQRVADALYRRAILGPYFSAWARSAAVHLGSQYADPDQQLGLLAIVDLRVLHMTRALRMWKNLVKRQQRNRESRQLGHEAYVHLTLSRAFKSWLRLSRRAAIPAAQEQVDLAPSPSNPAELSFVQSGLDQSMTLSPLSTPPESPHTSKRAHTRLDVKEERVNDSLLSFSQLESDSLTTLVEPSTFSEPLASAEELQGHLNASEDEDVFRSSRGSTHSVGSLASSQALADYLSEREAQSQSSSSPRSNEAAPSIDSKTSTSAEELEVSMISIGQEAHRALLLRRVFVAWRTVVRPPITINVNDSFVSLISL